jgi:hypothetical protein
LTNGMSYVDDTVVGIANLNLQSWRGMHCRK